MRISNRVRRNISFVLFLVGVACVIARGLELADELSSGMAWFNLFSIVFLTAVCFGRFRELQKRVRQGIIFGTR